MMGSRLLTALVALTLSLPAVSTRAQGCAAPPLANAGGDERRCTATFGSTDAVLSGALSQPNVLNGPIVSFCWTTDVGTFTSTGTATACSDRPSVTLRIANRSGRQIAHVQLLITDFSGCTDTDDVLVTLETPPVILLATTSQPIPCTGQPYELIARAADTFSSTGLLTYEWDKNLSVDSDLNGGTEDDADARVVGVSGAITAVTVVSTNAGVFSARLNVRGESSACVATMLVTFPRDETPTIAVLRAESLALCPGNVSTFHAELSTTSPSASLSWDFNTAADDDEDGDPTNDNQGAGSDVEWVFPVGGVTTIRVNATDASGCVGTRDLVVDVRPQAVAAFTTEGPGCGVLAVTFRDASVGQAPITASWNFGDGSTTEQGPVRTHVYSSSGIYPVQLTITDGTGCSSSTTRLLSIGPSALQIVGVQVFDGQIGTGTSGNRDGFADPGEDVRLAVTIRNSSAATATNAQVRAQLAGAAFGASIVDDTASLPSIPAGQAATTLSPHLQISLDDGAPCGGGIALQLIASGQLDTSCQSSLGYALRIGAPNVLPLGSEIRVTTTPGVEAHADIATAGDVHGVVFEDDQGDEDNPANVARILMRRYGSTGNFIDDARAVSPLGLEATDPHVAWSASTREFAVTWLEREPTSVSHALMLQRVSQGGELVGARVRVDINGGASSSDVIWSGDGWIVVFVDAPLSGTPVAWAQRLTPEGFLLGLPQRIDAGGGSQAFVRAAAGNGTWGAAIARTGTSSEAIVEIRSSGSVGTPIGVSNLGSTATEPFAIAASGLEYAVALSVAGRVDVLRVGVAGITAREAVGNGALPTLAAGTDAVFVAWQDGADVFARAASTSGEVVGSATLLSAPTGVGSEPVLSVASDGLFFIAWTDVRPASPEFPDIYARVLQEGASGECGTSSVLGDIGPLPDGNGTVDVGDVVLALRASVGLETVTGAALERGDVAPGTRVGTVHDIIGDGVIDVGDVVVLLQVTVNQITLVQ